jgi:hypothetical protein
VLLVLSKVSTLVKGVIFSPINPTYPWLWFLPYKRRDQNKHLNYTLAIIFKSIYIYSIQVFR